MNRQEFAKMMAFLTAAVERSPSTQTFEVYFEMLKDLPYELTMAAVKKVVAQDEYPTLPTIGKLRKAAQDLCRMDRLSAPEAWGAVLKAVQRHGYYGEAEAMEKLPENVGAVVEMVGWRDICHSDKPDVLRAQFMRMYETVEVRRKETELLPEDVKNYIAGVGKKMLTGGVKQ